MTTIKNNYIISCIVDVAGCAVGTDLESPNHQCLFSPGIIASRLYPNYIAVGSKETWLLQAPSNAFIELIFDVLRLSDEGDCSTSSIKVIASETPSISIASFCSGDIRSYDGMEVETDVDSVKVEVVTSQAQTVKFLAHYLFVGVEEDKESELVFGFNFFSYLIHMYVHLYMFVKRRHTITVKPLYTLRANIVWYYGVHSLFQK